MNARICPDKRPQEQESVIRDMLKAQKVNQAVALVGWRGYYMNAMGLKGKNDIAIYDDAFFLVGPGFYATFNGNTDPSRYNRPTNPKGMAILKPGVWQYQVGIHGIGWQKNRQYTALVQAGAVTVDRYQGDGKPTKPDKGYFGINIHKGTLFGTSSEGCQTIYPTQWPEFIGAVQSLLKRNKQKALPYLLMNDPRMK